MYSTLQVRQGKAGEGKGRDLSVQASVCVWPPSQEEPWPPVEGSAEGVRGGEGGGGALPGQGARPWDGATTVQVGAKSVQARTTPIQAGATPIQAGATPIQAGTTPVQTTWPWLCQGATAILPEGDL